jgi:putative ABC transport system ATP-binding protein
MMNFRRVLMKPVAETRNLHKIYHPNGVAVEALRGVDLQVAEGEFVAVMGPSGCGKSTLLHLLGGLDYPTEGTIIIVGRQIDNLDESARAVLRRATIGFVFQAYNLVPNLSVADNVDLPGLLLKLPAKRVKQRRQELIQALGIAEKEYAYPGELSGGQMQKVAIARALMNQPALLLVDEPTGNLDSRSGAAVMELLHQCHSGGQTIIMVTHDPKIAAYAEGLFSCAMEN